MSFNCLKTKKFEPSGILNKKIAKYIIDEIKVLTETDRARRYWSDLKSRLKKEGSQLSEKIGQLKMQSSDGKVYINAKSLLLAIKKTEI